MSKFIRIIATISSVLNFVIPADGIDDQPPRLKVVPSLNVVRIEPAKKLAEPAKKIAKPAIASKSSPRWNVNGSWSAANNRSKLINHLISSSNHGNYSRAYLESLTIGQLWNIHDSEHEGRKPSKESTGTVYKRQAETWTQPSWKPFSKIKQLCPT